MSKIICDICGTSYPETAECCPICGCSQESAEELLTDDLLEEEPKSKSGRFTAKKKEIFDFDEVNSEDEEDDYDEEEDDEEEDYDEEDEEEAPRHNTLLVILLTILIAGLLIAAGFIFVRYFLPNMKGDDAAVPQNTTSAVAEAATETAAPTIPCETLIISSGTVAELNAEGQHFLLHIKAMPENTTDKIIYTSADESIATVTEDGRITAVSEGETTIYISCGKSSIECPVIIQYVEETVPPTTEAATEATEAATMPVVEAVDPAEPAQDKSGVVLKLKKTDIKLAVYYQFTLELDCDLEQNEVQWSSEHPHIATVDENGVVTAVKYGTTEITAKYGDQEVTCIVRCG